MGDRFYFQQLKQLGNCPGNRKFKPKRKTKMPWDADKKDEAVKMYLKANPTPETSMEIVKEIAEDLNESPNGVRMILTKAGVYVKKAEAAKSQNVSGGKGSKTARIEALTAALSDAGQEINEDVISKLTGIQAEYFTNIIVALNK